MLNVAVLDDYQNVTRKFANWSELDGKISLKVFNKYFDNSNELVKCLSDFEVLCLMRERTILSSSIINQLPKLKLVITTGMWNPSVDTDTLNKRKIVFCGTENSIESTAELAWLLYTHSHQDLARVSWGYPQGFQTDFPQQGKHPLMTWSH